MSKPRTFPIQMAPFELLVTSRANCTFLNLARFERNFSLSNKHKKINILFNKVANYNYTHLFQ